MKINYINLPHSAKILLECPQFIRRFAMDEDYIPCRTCMHIKSIDYKNMLVECCYEEDKEVSNLAKEHNIMSEDNKKEDHYFLFRMDVGSDCEYIGEYSYKNLIKYIDDLDIEPDEISEFKIIKGKTIDYKLKMVFEEEICEK